MEVVAGSYEELLLGYKLVKSDDEGYKLEQSFTDHSHTGCVKTVAVSQKGILASGSTDETIRLFNLRKRKEMGSLIQHMGSVTCLEFFKGSHLFSCAEDGRLCVWKSFTWECLKIMKGHKGGISCLSIHPSGKMALTVGKDKTLHTWNLMTGRSAYVSNIKQVAELVKWSPDGNHYIVVYNNTIDVYKVETCSIHTTITAARRINSAAFLDTCCLVYGGEGGDLHMCDITTGTELFHQETGTNRIRGISVSLSFDDNSKHWVTTVSSDGVINVYEIKLDKTAVESKLLAKLDTKFRLTCVAVTQYSSPEAPSRKQKDSSEDIKEELKESLSEHSSDSHSDASESETEKAQVIEKSVKSNKPKTKSSDSKNSKMVSKKRKKTSTSEVVDTEEKTKTKQLMNKKRKKKVV